MAVYSAQRDSREQFGNYITGLRQDTSKFTQADWDNYVYGFNPYQQVAYWAGQNDISQGDTWDYMTNLANQEYQNRQKQYELWYSQNQLQQEREYNTPAAQAQRMREAGLNPDLVGLNGAGDSSMSDFGAGNAAPAPVSQSQAQMSSEQAKSTRANMIINILGQALSVVEGFQGFQNQQFVNDSIAIDNGAKSLAYLRDLSTYARYNSKTGGFDYSYRIPRSVRQRLTLAQLDPSAQALGSSKLNSEVYSNVANEFESKHKMNVNRILYTGDDMDMIVADVLKASREAEKQSYKTAKVKDRYEERYWTGANPDYAFGAFNAENSAASKMSEITDQNRLYYKSFQDQMDKLIQGQKDHPLNQAVLSLISMLMTSTFNGNMSLPSFGVTRTPMRFGMQSKFTFGK